MIKGTELTTWGFNLEVLSSDNFLSLFYISDSKFPHVVAVWEPMIGDRGKDEKVETNARCRAVVRASDSEEEAEAEARRGMTDVMRSQARKCALASLCIFQETRVRRAAVKWHETDRIPAMRQAASVCAIACFFPLCLPYHPETPTIRFIRPPRPRLSRGLSRRFYYFRNFPKAEPGRKLLMPVLPGRKPQLRRFERVTAMRAISSRGWLSAGRSERWTCCKNTGDSRDLRRKSPILQ